MNRSAMLAKVHIAKKDLGLDDDTYRAVLQRVTGLTSAAKCSDAQLEAVLAHFKAEGFKAVSKARSKPVSSTPHAAKIRSLWISLYELGLIADASERALAAFVKRQAKVDRLEWLTPAQAYKVIEGLKAWASRDAGVDWSPIRITKYWNAGRGVDAEEDRPRQRVIEAQWRRLAALGAVREDPPALDAYARKVAKISAWVGLGNLSDSQLDAVIRALGSKLRKLIAAQAAKEA